MSRDSLVSLFGTKKVKSKFNEFRTAFNKFAVEVGTRDLRGPSEPPAAKRIHEAREAVRAVYKELLVLLPDET